MRRRSPGASPRRFEALSLSSFIALGLPDGMIGTAWPAMRREFHAPVGDLGLVLVVSTAGSIAVAGVVGAAIRRVGIPPLLAVAGVAAALGAAGFSGAPALPVVVGVSFLLGLSAGAMDGGLNTAVGLSQRKRLLNLLHGAYGVGTAAGPLLVTAAILAGSWRAAYLALLAVDVVLATLWWAARNTVGQPMARAAPTRAARPGHGRRRRYPRLQVLGGMGVFFVYTGLEVSAGQWETSFGRQHLGLSAAVAGIATFGYWGALTASRLVLAASRRQVPSLWVVRGGSGAAIAATAVIWWQPGVAATLGGFAVLGAALAGIFPAMVALTPIRLGNRRAQDVIAWQIGAAAAGGSGTAALVGVLIGAGGFAVLGPSLLAMAVLLAAGDVAVWGTGRREPPVA